MPTGYTARVQTGQTTTLRDYALTCARAFGALVTMRDEPNEAPIPQALTVDSYYIEAVNAAEAHMTNILRMPLSEARVAAQHEYDAQMDRYQEVLANTEVERKRYEDMVLQVMQWKPPTEDHYELKDFMLEQLRSSVKFCSYVPSVPGLLSGAEWLQEQKAAAAERLQYCTESLQKQQKAVAEKNKWLQDLRDSL